MLLCAARKDVCSAHLLETNTHFLNGHETRNQITNAFPARIVPINTHVRCDDGRGLGEIVGGVVWLVLFSRKMNGILGAWGGGRLGILVI